MGNKSYTPQTNFLRNPEPVERCTLRVQKHHQHLFPEALSQMEQLKWLACFLWFPLFFLTLPTHLNSFVSSVLKDGYSEWEAAEPTKLLLSSVSLRAPGPLDLDGAIIAGCCTANHSLPQPRWVHPLEITITGWQNPAPGKCLCLRLPLTLLMTSLDGACNSTEATFRAKFLSSRYLQQCSSTSCLKFQELKKEGVG